MQPFEYSRVQDRDAALTALSAGKGSKLVAGGTNLLDLMKEHVETPRRLVDINDVPMAAIEATAGGVRIGALSRMSDTAANDLIRKKYPALSQALLLSASPQLRNMASMGGNLMQRTRCPYFRDITFSACNKREPGSGCSAIPGENRMHAILGTSDSCIATHPSDFAVALAAFDGVVQVQGPKGARDIAATDFHLLPGTTPHREHALGPDEIITAIVVPAAAHTERSHYLKVRDRASYEFALTSAAVGLDVGGTTIRSARVALGGVGTKPWRSREAESVLTGRNVSEALFREAAEAALGAARPQRQNGFKVELAKRTIVRALQMVSGGVA
ncbi:MAG TPA: xanthine dehydrogenase family protein subunit M [Thermoanaerobaculia bacterium]|nr:xanthine dehydrogenase family protein subunit M [Thermoanaerobaculia bacterium]